MNFIVFLTGGLGNQLFQTANALSKAKGDPSKILFEVQAGNPRSSFSGKPEVFDYLKFEPRKIALKTNSFVSKLFGLNIRFSSHTLSTRSKFFEKNLLAFFTSITVSLFNLKVIRVLLNNGLGYDSASASFKSRLNTVMIGYFQSYLFFENKYLSHNLQIKDKNRRIEILRIKDNFKLKNVVAIHVRRGDYLQEKNFGVLEVEYYVAAVEYFKKIGYNDFLIFSDEIEEAKNIFTSCHSSNIRYFEVSGLSSCETLEIMEHAGGFIIANSTFSWWAAYLRKNISAPVVAPTNWFTSINEPNQLIPTSWVRI